MESPRRTARKSADGTALGPSPVTSAGSLCKTSGTGNGDHQNLCTVTKVNRFRRIFVVNRGYLFCSCDLGDVTVMLWTIKHTVRHLSPFNSKYRSLSGLFKSSSIHAKLFICVSSFYDRSTCRFRCRSERLWRISQKQTDWRSWNMPRRAATEETCVKRDLQLPHQLQRRFGCCHGHHFLSAFQGHISHSFADPPQELSAPKKKPSFSLSHCCWACLWRVDLRIGILRPL